jgi:hypothetical protein
LPPPQSFSGGTSEGSSFVGGAHLPMSMFINAVGSSSTTRGVPDNVFDLFDADKHSRGGHSEFDRVGGSNVFDIFNEPSQKESGSITSMTLSDFLQNENHIEIQPLNLFFRRLIDNWELKNKIKADDYHIGDIIN